MANNKGVYKILIRNGKKEEGNIVEKRSNLKVIRLLTLALGKNCTTVVEKKGGYQSLKKRNWKNGRGKWKLLGKGLGRKRVALNEETVNS